MGVMATRYSWFLTSLGMPIFMSVGPPGGSRDRAHCRLVQSGLQSVAGCSARRRQIHSHLRHTSREEGCDVNDIRPVPPRPSTLDDVDRALLRALAADARTPNNALAAAVGIAPSTCLARVRRLVADGVIRGFHADLSP